MNAKAKKVYNKSSGSKKTSKKIKNNSWLSRFNPRSNPIAFVLLFAVVGVLGVFIANAQTTEFSFEGQLSGTRRSYSKEVVVDNTGNLTASLTWDRKTEVNFMISDGSGATVFNKTSAQSPTNVAIPVSKGKYKLTVSKVGWNVKFKVVGKVVTNDVGDTSAPTAPTNLKATLTDATTASLTWTASSDNIGVVGYKVYRNGLLIKTTTAATQSDSGLVAGTLYEYTVSAYDAAGNPSPSSNIASVTTAGTPTTPPPPTSSNKLRWSPPALSSPETKTVGPSGGTISLTGGKDYIISVPQKVSGPVTITGGRNVQLIGGHITIPYVGSSPSGPNSRRGLYLKDQTGTVHVEGLLIDNSGSDLSEGIQISAPLAIIQIQNVRITGAHARDQSGYTDNHPDLIQPWGGAKELRIDRFSGSTDYQAFMLKADSNGPLGPTLVSNVNIWAEPSNLSRYLLWQGKDSEYNVLSYDNVWLVPASGRSLGKSVWPDIDSSNAEKRAILSADGNSITWPSTSKISGTVRKGTPPGGDFVPASLVGLNYTSPGYQ